MKKGITFIEVIIGMVIIATSITVLLTMMQVYNSSYNSTKSYNDSMNEIIRVKEVIDQFMERNRNKQFKYKNNALYIEEELVLDIKEDCLTDYQSSIVLLLDQRIIEIIVYNNNLLCFHVEVDEIKQDFMYFIGGFIIDS